MRGLPSQLPVFSRRLPAIRFSQSTFLIFPRQDHVPRPELQEYLDFIDIYAALDDNARAEYQRDYPDEAKTMSRFAERFHEQGM